MEAAAFFVEVPARGPAFPGCGVACPSSAAEAVRVFSWLAGPCPSDCRSSSSAACAPPEVAVFSVFFGWAGASPAGMLLSVAGLGSASGVPPAGITGSSASQRAPKANSGRVPGASGVSRETPAGSDCAARSCGGMLRSHANGPAGPVHWGNPAGTGTEPEPPARFCVFVALFCWAKAAVATPGISAGSRPHADASGALATAGAGIPAGTTASSFRFRSPGIGRGFGSPDSPGPLACARQPSRSDQKPPRAAAGALMAAAPMAAPPLAGVGRALEAAGISEETAITHPTNALGEPNCRAAFQTVTRRTADKILAGAPHRQKLAVARGSKPFFFCARPAALRLHEKTA